MSKSRVARGRLLAEVLRLQRWAGGDSVDAARIFALTHGFESAIREETEDSGISAKTQRRVEDILEEVEAGTQLPDGMSLKSRLHQEGIDESDAACVMTLCWLQSRFGEAIQAISAADGCVFPNLMHPKGEEQDWFGALHYMELVDCSEDGQTQSYAVFAPCVPRVGERLTLEGGAAREVVDVEHVMVAQKGGDAMSYLVPYVHLQAVQKMVSQG